MSSVAENLHTVRAAIIQAARAGARPPEAVTLVAVSKTQPAEAIAEALAAGQRVFGENRVQEAKGKWPELRRRFGGVELHLIGPLQTNKVKDAVALFDVIQSVDREKLARALGEEMARSGKRLRCLIQVNTGHEAQKAGIAPERTEAFVCHCRDDLGLPIIGLMCIPPVDDDPAPHFKALADLAARCSLGVISMGMSGDFPLAIGLGATHVRVGTAIFGERSQGQEKA